MADFHDFQDLLRNEDFDIVVHLLNVKSAGYKFEDNILSNTDLRKLFIAPFGEKKMKQIAESSLGEINNALFYPVFPVQIHEFLHGVDIRKKLQMDSLFVLYAAFANKAEILSHDKGSNRLFSTIFYQVRMRPIFFLNLVFSV